VRCSAAFKTRPEPFARAAVYSLKMRNAIVAISVFFLSFVALGQTAFGQAPKAERLTFDVASIKPFTPQPPGPGGRGGLFITGGGGPGTADPGRITRSGSTLRDLLTTAYDVKRYQVTGPSWMDTERYEIVAKVPEGATKEQVKVMWQNLLADRFGVVFHRESKEFQVEELTVAKGGLKLKPTELDPNAPPPGPAPAGPGGLPPPPKMDANGFPQLPGPGLIVMIGPGANGSLTAHMTARAQSPSDLAGMLGNELNKPVVDQTGISGKFDFNLEYTPDLAGRGLPPPPPGAGPGGVGGAGTPGDAAEPGSNLATAVQQLGLKLSAGKAKLDVLVIDKAEKTPTEN
jgi:uncharacterized protein (TIGR03435 family)